MLNLNVLNNFSKTKKVDWPTLPPSLHFALFPFYFLNKLGGTHETKEKLVLTEQYLTLETGRKSCSTSDTCHQSREILPFGSTFKKNLHVISYNDF